MTANRLGLELSLFPDKLSYHHYEPANVITKNFRIKNCSKTGCTIVIEPPKQPHFRIVKCGKDSYLPPYSFLAPGMDLVISVAFKGPSKDFEQSSQHDWDLSVSSSKFIGESSFKSLKPNRKREGNIIIQDDKNRVGMAEADEKLDPSEREYKDMICLNVKESKNVINVPLIATPAVSKVQMPQIVDFGTIIQSKAHLSLEESCQFVKKSFAVKNMGEKPCYLHFINRNNVDGITFQPSSFFLEGNQFSSSVHLEKDSKSPAHQQMKLETIVTVSIDTTLITKNIDIAFGCNLFTVRPLYGSDKPFLANDKVSKTIQLKGIVTEQSLNINVGNLQTTRKIDIDFGTSFLGQRNLKRLKLQNTGPLAAFCRLVTAKSEGEEEDNNSIQNTVIVIEPSNLEIAPNQEAIVLVRMITSNNEADVGFKSKPLKEYSENFRKSFSLLVAYSELKESGQDVMVLPSKNVLLNEVEVSKITCIGNNYPLCVTLNPLEINFPECHVNEKSHVPLTIQNHNEALGVWLSIPTIAQFTFEPNGKFYLGPNETKTVKVVFYPRQLGVFDLEAKISIRSSKQTQSFKFLSLMVRGKSMLKDALKKEISTMNSSTSWKIPSITPNLIEKDKFFLKFQEKHPELLKNKFSAKKIPMEERKKLEHNRKPYQKYLIARRENRISETRSKLVFSDKSFTNKDLLMLNEIEDTYFDPFTGLVAPDLELSCLQQDNNLTNKPKRGGSLENLAMQMESTLDLIPTKHIQFKLGQLAPQYGSTTNNPKILNEIQKAIHPHELTKIYCLSPNIDLGTLILNTKRDICVNFYNGTHHYIKLGIKPISIPGVIEGTIDAPVQLVPKKAPVGFSLSFKATSTGTFNESIHYMVNDRHLFTLNYSAVVIPLTLELSTKEIRFEDLTSRLHKGEIQNRETFYEEQVIVLTNSYNVPANFVWSTVASNYKETYQDALKKTATPALAFATDDCFFISPRYGSVEPKSTLSVTVRFIPGSRQKYDEVWYLAIENGDRLSISCHALVTPTTCVVNIKDVEYGTIPVYGIEQSLIDEWVINGSVYERVLKLRNTGTLDTFFYIPNIDGVCVNITPSEGLLPAGAMVDLVSQVNPTSVGKCHMTTNICYLGARGLRLGITYVTVEPHVMISSCDLTFKETVYVGNEGRRYFNIINTESVQAQLLLDLSGNREFYIECPNITSNLNNQPQGRDPANKQQQYQLVQELEKRSEIKGDREDEPDGNTAKSSSRFFNIIVPPKETLHLALVFQPLKGNFKHEFQLPIRLLGSNDIKWHSDASPRVSAESKPAPLSISADSILFKNQVVYPVDNELMYTLQAWDDRRQHHERITISNQWPRSIQWRMFVKSASNDVNAFRFDPKFGEINAGEIGSVEVKFRPSKLGPSHSEIVIEALSDGKPVSSYNVSLSGMGFEPALIFDPPEIFLPIVPIGVESIASFTIINYGCDRREIKVKSPYDANPLNLELSFPQGKRLKCDGERLLVFIKAKCAKPISFSTHIEFETADNHTFRVRLNGTFDNSILTNFLFMSLTRKEGNLIGQADLDKIDSFGIPKDDVVLSQRSKLDRYYKFFTTPGGMPLDTEAILGYSSLLNQISSSLMSWFADVFVMPTPVTSLPGSFIQSNGKLIFELIQVVGGKKNIPLSFKAPVGNGDEKLIFLEKQYSSVLNHLRSRGAFLSSVSSEFLLSKPEFKKWNQARLSNMKQQSNSFVSEEYINYLALLEKNFEIVSKEAWVTVILQIIKTFLFDRINMKQLRITVNEEGANTDWMNITPNRLYSQPELILMKWVAHQYHKIRGKYIKIMNYENPFQDCGTIASLIQSFIPLTAQTDLKSFEYNVTSEEQLKKNASIICKTLQNLFPGFHFTPDRFLSPFLYDMLILCAYLFLVLPEFIPKSTILFKGKMHEKIIKYVEINNPTNKPLTYLVQLEGASEFSVKDITVNVPSKSEVKYAIDFFGRFSRTAKALISLRSSKMALETSSVLVFTLLSDVEKPTPTEIFEIEGPIYSQPPVTLNIDVKNPFPIKGKFAIILKTSKNFAKGEDTQKPKSVDHLSAIDENNNDSIPPAFRISNNEVFMEALGTAKLSLFFCPFTIGNHETLLHFIDENAGEFLYHIKGKGTYPTTFEQFTISCKCNSRMEKSLKIPACNNAREKAISNFLSHQKQRAGKKEAYLISKLKPKYDLPKSSLLYQVSYSNQHFKGPSEITIDLSRSDENIEETFEDLPVVFEPRLPGRYSCYIVLTTTAANDIRVFRVDGVSIAEGSRAEMELQAPARQKIIQEIPLANKTTESWSVRAFLQGSSVFSGPNSILAKANQVTMYPLVFSPNFKGEFNALLNLTNNQTGQTFIYSLKGIGEEPVAENNFEINCKARQEVVKLIPITNPLDHEDEFQIVSGLPNILGQTNIKVAARSTLDYKLMFQPNSGGTIQDSLSFISKETGERYWYSFTVNVESPDPEGVIEVSTILREEVAISIDAYNPADLEITYSVIYDDKEIIGPKTLTVPPKQKVSCQLIFNPLSSSGKRTSRVTFRNEIVAEFSYDLNLQVLPPKDIDLKDMKCPLGLYSTQIFYISNKSKADCNFGITYENTDGVYILSQQDVISKTKLEEPELPLKEIKLPAQSTKKVFLVYWPCAKTTSVGRIRFKDDNYGEIVYNIKVTGLPPVKAENLTITGLFESESNFSIDFNNPFREQISVNVNLGAIDSQLAPETLQLLSTKKGKQLVAAKQILTVPFMYFPTKMKRLETNLFVEMSDDIKWIYPITAIPEWYVQPKTISISGKVGQSVSQIIEFPVQNFPQIEKEQSNEDIIETFLNRTSFYIKYGEFSSTNEEDHEIIPSLISTIIGRTLPDNATEYPDPIITLKMKLEFIPKASFLRSCDLVVEDIDGGLWKQTLDLHSTIRDIDEIINMNLLTSGTSEVRFQLTNPSDHPIAFETTFEDNSYPDMIVNPSKGILRSKAETSSEDNQFLVTISRNENEISTTVYGTLVVKTSEWTYSYLIRAIPSSNSTLSAKAALMTPKSKRFGTPSKSKKPATKNLFKKTDSKENVLSKTNDVLLPPISSNSSRFISASK